MRSILLVLAMVLGAAVARAGDGWVRVEGGRFVRDGAPWFVCGANLWYGANLGRPSNPAGRARLLRELDRLQALGVNNLRVLGSSQACSLAGAVSPVIETAPGVYNQDMLQGLDFLVAEAGRRHMTLVVFLGNFWDWSGGFPQYLAWVSGRPAQGVDTSPWKDWNRLQSTFYTSEKAQGLYRDYVAMLVTRTNTVNGLRYADDPAIMAWELANEPRPGERDEDPDAVFDAFVRWVDGASGRIHALDGRHLVTTGSEGSMGCLYQDERVRRVNAVRGVDYMVFHLWPKNWRWFDASRYRETIDATLLQARDYVGRHLSVAAAVGKPCVIEEFGLDRDGGLGAGVPTTCRDRYYSEVFSMIEASAASGGPAAGSNFWVWGGEGRPPLLANAADGIGSGDMPQEPSGLNTVFDTDASTLRILSRHFGAIRALRPAP